MQSNGTKRSIFQAREIHLTKTERAIQAIRDAVLRGTFQADEQFSIVELAERLGMSQTPVREAVRALQAEGLLQQTPHHTISAIPFTEQDIMDVFDLRVVLEGEATRLATPSLTADDFDEIAAILTQMRATLRAADYSSIHRLNADWHLAIYRASNNPILIETIMKLWRKFLWESLWSMPSHSQISLDQHEEILLALRARDADRAARLMGMHLLHGQLSAVIYARDQRDSNRGHATASTS
ncbi:MAG TPA: GntR family transcriptional regulator [Ktedonobacterales bacterium]|nr:GntR family transcriptional regulator [Ktedonobacterales bacterium]